MLFGSRARGTAHTASDWDVAVLAAAGHEAEAKHEARKLKEWSRLTSSTKLGGRPLYTKTPELRDRLGSFFDRMLVDSDRSRPGQ